MEDCYSSTYMVLHWGINNTVFSLPESEDWESDPEKEILICVRNKT